MSQQPAEVAPNVCDPLERVKEWVLSKNGKLLDIEPDADLVEGRVIDSIQFIDLVLLIESIRGKPIDYQYINLSSFRTLRTIGETFFHPEREGESG